VTIRIQNIHQTSDPLQLAVSPFSGVTISDSSGAADTVTVTLSPGSNGSLSGAGVSYNNGVYTCSGVAAVVTADLENLLFTPNNVANPVYSVVTGFTISVSNASGATATDASTSVIEGPAIDGIVASQVVAPGTTYNPFATVSILDAAPLVELVITLHNTSSGSLSSLTHLGSYNSTTGQYSLGWLTVAQMNQDIAELEFIPAADPSGAPVVSPFTIEVSDDAAQFITYGTVTVTEQGPSVGGIQTAQTDTGRTTIHPFSAATIGDVLANQSETVTVTLNPNDGTLSGGGFSQSITNPGTYTVSAANIGAATADLNSLAFTPNTGPSGQSVVTTFAIEVTDGRGFNNTDTITVSDYYPPVPVVALGSSPFASNSTPATLGTAAPGTTGDALSVMLTSDADFATGSRVVLNNGTLVYTPGVVTASLAGPDTLTYTVTDTVTQSVTTETQTVTLSNGPNPVVTPANSPAASNSTTATLATAVPGTGSDALSVTLTSDADFTSGSTLVLNHGSLIYTPGLITAAKAGTDTLGFSVTDTVTGAITTDTETVTLSNGPAPVVTLAVSATTDNSTTATLGTAAPGAGSDALSVRLTSDADFPSGSTLVLINGNLVYTPGLVTAALSGSSDTLTYTVTDTVTGAVTPETQTVALLNGPVLSTDILFQNENGQMAQWTVSSGLSISTGAAIGPNPGSSWFAMGTGAFYTGDTADIVWQNQNGQVAVWQVQGTTLLGGAVVTANPGTTWHIKGTGDFYGDANTDILWQNDNGSVALWDMNGGSIVQAAVLAENPGPSWHIEGTGNFYGDGNTDILWQNDDGSVAFWDMNGTSIVHGAVLADNPGSTWHIKGTGDFYGDGNTDILWQNDNGSVAIWDMNGTSIVQAGVVAANPGSTWHIEAVGDFNNNGKADIVWQNDNGSVAVWEMNGTNIVSAAVLANPSTSWSVLGGDQNMRFIYSGSAGETLAATPVAPEEFVFTAPAAGAHAITGFNVTQDAVELSSALFGSFAAVEAATTATAGGTLIHLGASSSLFLAGVSPGSLHAGNFALA
jgi:hypothetical protein